MFSLCLVWMPSASTLVPLSETSNTMNRWPASWDTHTPSHTYMGLSLQSGCLHTSHQPTVKTNSVKNISPTMLHFFFLPFPFSLLFIWPVHLFPPLFPVWQTPDWSFGTSCPKGLNCSKPQHSRGRATSEMQFYKHKKQKRWMINSEQYALKIKRAINKVNRR